MKRNFSFKILAGFLLEIFIFNFRSTLIAQDLPQSVSNLTRSINTGFIWSEISDSEGKLQKNALLLPVKIKGLDKVFYMQLDTGSNRTIFYSKRMQTIFAKFGNADIVTLDNRQYIKQMTIRISDNEFNLGNALLRNSGYDEKIDFDDPKSVNVIGSIGFDFLKSRVFEIDYSTNAFRIYDENYKFDSSIKPNKLSIIKDQILLHCDLNDRKTKFLFDTGSSRFSLLTSIEEFDRIRLLDAPTKTDKIKSFEDYLNVQTAPTLALVKIGGETIPLEEISAVDTLTAGQKFLMAVVGIKGITGNKLFLGRKLIIDLRNGQYAIVPN